MVAMAAILLKDDKEWWAIFEALGQYVENGQCNDAVDDPYEADEHLEHAEAVHFRMSAQVAALAEG